jgi:hypothetical protein
MECRYLIVEVNGDPARTDRPTHLKKTEGPIARSTDLLHLDIPVVPRLVTGHHHTTNIKIPLGGHRRRDMVDLLAGLTHLLLPDSNITSRRRILVHTHNPRWIVGNVQSHGRDRIEPGTRACTRRLVSLLPVEMDLSLEDQEIGMRLPFAPVATPSSHRVRWEGLARLGKRLRIGMQLERIVHQLP